MGRKIYIEWLAGWGDWTANWQQIQTRIKFNSWNPFSRATIYIFWRQDTSETSFLKGGEFSEDSHELYSNSLDKIDFNCHL